MKNDILVILHLYYQDLWPEFKGYLNNINNFDLCISICREHDDKIINTIKKDFPHARFLITENRGADIGPFFEWMQILIEEEKEYKYLLKIHTKKSIYLVNKNNTSDNFRRSCITPLIRSKEVVNNILGLLEKKEVGMLGAKSKFISDSPPGQKNLIEAEDHMVDIMRKFNITTKRRCFFGGTMFWCKYNVLKKYFSRYRIGIDYFEPGPHSGRKTAAHAAERIFGRIFMNENMKIICVE